mmetsp:Transcript_16893/g.29072  ORF Transcript_16893/g.29072 Transcript_16893/m.29072 type:complete len:407 (+) Transcript_16893:208-1428(+)
MTSLVVGNKLILLLGKHGSTSLLLKTNHDTVNSTINFLPSNGRFGLAGGSDSSLVHEVLKLGARESRSTATNGLKINIGLKGLSTSVNAKDTSTSPEVGKVHSDLPVETSRTKECLIKNVNPVGGCNGDNSRVSIESIHLYQNLVNSLFPLIVSTSESSTTLTSDSIDLINEDNAGSVLLRLREDVTDTRRSNTNEHLNELRSRDGDEGHSSLTSNSLGKKGLTSTGRSIKDNSPWNSAAVLRVHLRLLQEINNLSQLQLGAIASSNILKVHASIRNHLNFGLGLTHSHGVSRSAHTSGHSTAASTTGEEKETGEERSRENERLSEITKATSGLVGGEDGHINLVRSELSEEVRIVGEGLKLDACSISVHSKKLGSICGEGDLFNAVAIDKLKEVRITNVNRGASL